MIGADRQSDKFHWEHFWASKKHAGDVYSNAERVISQILKATPVRHKRILEVGAGTGRDGFQLVDAGAKVFLLDYAEQSLSLMKEVAREDRKHVMLIKGDALALPFKNESFDVVFHQGLLEHFRDPAPLLRENYRTLCSGGICLVDVPQKFHVYTVIKHLLICLNGWFAGWETEFSVRDLGKLTRRVGFQVRIFYGDWMRPSLFYRILREILMRVGLSLPMYPKGFKRMHSLRRHFRELISRFPLYLYTCLNIGVVVEKPLMPRP